MRQMPLRETSSGSIGSTAEVIVCCGFQTLKCFVIHAV